MNEPSPHLAEANDMELATTQSPPSESWTVWYASVSAAAIVYGAEINLLSYRQLDEDRFCLYGPTSSAARNDLYSEPRGGAGHNLCQKYHLATAVCGASSYAYLL